MDTLRHLWERWKVIAHKIGTFQARLMLTMFYYLILAPFAIGARLFSDPLRLRAVPAAGWSVRVAAADDPMTAARRQF